MSGLILGLGRPGLFLTPGRPEDEREPNCCKPMGKDMIGNDPFFKDSVKIPHAFQASAKSSLLKRIRLTARNNLRAQNETYKLEISLPCFISALFAF